VDGAIREIREETSDQAERSFRNGEEKNAWCRFLKIVDTKRFLFPVKLCKKRIKG
jgi:hypothetical protein